MSPRGKRRRKKTSRRIAVRRGLAAGGTVTLATLGLTTCNDGGGGAVDPLPPPVLCKDVNQGQDLYAVGMLQDSTLTVGMNAQPGAAVDTVYVTDVTGASLESADVSGATHIALTFTLDADTTSLVTFTVSGTYDLDGGPCNFTRAFTVTIDNGAVVVAQERIRVPLDVRRDVRIELVERDGVRLRLRAVGAAGLSPVWRVTGGALEPEGNDGIVWRLPSEPGFYQVEVLVDRGEDGFMFDALSLEVT